MCCREFAASPRGETPRKEWGVPRRSSWAAADPFSAARVALILECHRYPHGMSGALRECHPTLPAHLRCGRTPHTRYQGLPDRQPAPRSPSLEQLLCSRTRTTRQRGPRTAPPPDGLGTGPLGPSARHSPVEVPMFFPTSHPPGPTASVGRLRLWGHRASPRPAHSPPPTTPAPGGRRPLPW